LRAIKQNKTKRPKQDSMFHIHDLSPCHTIVVALFDLCFIQLPLVYSDCLSTWQFFCLNYWFIFDESVYILLDIKECFTALW